MSRSIDETRLAMSYITLSTFVYLIFSTVKHLKYMGTDLLNFACETILSNG